MATIRVLMWNIERFGAFDKWKKGPDDTWIDGTLSAMALVLKHRQTDVLVIQEFRKAGEKYLKRLLKHLGLGWSYDYLPGAFKQDTKGAGDINGFDTLQYSGQSQTEGYAVVWKGDVLAAFSKSARMSNGGFINLVLKGSAPGYDFKKDIKIFPNGKGFNGDTQFPISKGATLVAGDDALVASLTPVLEKTRLQEKLKSSSSSSSSNNSSSDPNEKVLRFDVARRASIVNIKVSTGSNPATVPMIVYHAPAAAPSSIYGVMACALVAEVGASNQSAFVFGGDLNLTDKSHFATARLLYETVLKCTIGTTQGTRLDEGGFTRSQIQFKGAFSKASQFVKPDAVWEHARDILFHRGLKVTESGVYDVVQELRNPSSELAEDIFTNDYVRRQVLGATGLAMVSPAVGSKVSLEETALKPYGVTLSGVAGDQTSGAKALVAPSDFSVTFNGRSPGAKVNLLFDGPPPLTVTLGNFTNDLNAAAKEAAYFQQTVMNSIAGVLKNPPIFYGFGTAIVIPGQDLAARGLRLVNVTTDQNGPAILRHSPLKVDLDFASGTAPGGKVSITFNEANNPMVLTATNSSSPGANQFAIGAKPENTAANFRAAVIDAVINGLGDQTCMLPKMIRDDKEVMRTFLFPFTGGPPAFPSNSLGAAIYYRCFITDHLPLYCEFET
jgi:hypothetical protein